MAVYTDFTISRMEDGILTLSLRPPTAIGGWSIRYLEQKRFGGLSGTIKSAASGYSAVSGITIANSGQGVINIALNSVDTSGLDYGNYAWVCERMDSGNRSILGEGYKQILPGGAL